MLNINLFRLIMRGRHRKGSKKVLEDFIGHSLGEDVPSQSQRKLVRYPGDLDAPKPVKEHTSRAWNWINQNREFLGENYEGKTIVVWDDKVQKVYDRSVTPKEIREYASLNCPHSDWGYRQILCRDTRVV